MKKLLHIALAILVASCVGGTAPQPHVTTPADSDSVQTIVNIVDTATAFTSLTPQQADSLAFRLTHHYSENFNFVVKADSLTLLPREGDLTADTCRVRRGDLIAVAAIKTVVGDSIDSVWVKVASNQTTMGWIPEQELLRSAAPDDPISEMLYALSSSRALWMTALLALGLIALVAGKTLRHKPNGTERRTRLARVFRLGKLPSPYPPLFLALVAAMAAIYATVQRSVPEFWQEYYFHPTLNPLILPPLMAALVSAMWLVVITFVAVLDEVYRHLPILHGATYVAQLLGLAMLVYLATSWAIISTQHFIVCLVIVCAIILAARHIRKQISSKSKCHGCPSCSKSGGHDTTEDCDGCNRGG